MNWNRLSAVGVDVLGLFLAGLINTFLASLDASLIVGPGTDAFTSELSARMHWIATHTLRWQGGWLFWFAVTLSFAWAYFALGRHLNGNPVWRALAGGLAVIAAAVDLVGVLINIVVLPELAASPSMGASSAPLVFAVMEKLAYAATNVTAFGLYSVAGLVLLPAVFSTSSYPRWLAWLGVVEWGVALLATLLLVVLPAWATVPLLLSFILYAPWVWGSAFWVLQQPVRLS